MTGLIPGGDKGKEIATGAAVGGGVGAAGGALATLLQKQPSLRKALKNAVMGAAGGVAIGGGTMAVKQIKSDKPKEAEPAPAETKPAPKQINSRHAAAAGLVPFGIGSAVHAYQEGGQDQALRSGGRALAESAAGATTGVGLDKLTKGKANIKGIPISAIAALLGGAHGSYAAAENFNKREAEKSAELRPDKWERLCERRGICPKCEKNVVPDMPTLAQCDCTKEKSAATAEDVDRLLKNDGIGAHIEDALMLPGSRRRAGRATGMADSLGNEAGSSVTHPRTTRALAALLGAGIGSVAGHHLDKAQGDPANGTLKGTYGGAVGGAGIASLLAGLVRRHETNRVGEETKADLAAGKKPTPNIGKGSLLAAIRAAEHEQGRADTAENIATGRRRFEGSPGLTALEALGIPLGLPANVVNAADARSRLDRSNPMPVRLA